MKIALINQPWNFCPPPKAGSIAIWTYEIARQLANSHEVLVYARRGKNDPVTEISHGLTFKRYPVEMDLSLQSIAEKLKIGNAYRPLFIRKFYYYFYIRNIAKDIAESKVDIIHLHNMIHFASILKKYIPSTRIVLHMHCEWLTQLDFKITRPLVSDYDAIVGCSDHITMPIRERYGSLNKEIRTIYNGATIVPVKNRGVSDRVQLLFVGRITPEKGLHNLIDVFIQLREKYKNLYLKIVGPEAITPVEYIIGLDKENDLSHLEKFYEKSYLQILKEMIPAEEAEYIEFTGPVAHDDLAIHYSDADILINPSFSESFGMTLIEAMTFNLPVIASSAGGMKEIVEDNESGFLVTPGNIEQLRDRIELLINDEEKRLAMGRAGGNIVARKFSWEAVSAELETLYRDMQNS